MRGVLVAGAVAPALLVAAAIGAQPANGEPIRYLAATCANCHGTMGHSTGAMPSLAGLQKPYFVEQMRLFREGKRPATIMHQLAKGYSEQQVELLAEYFARQGAAR